MTGVAFIVLMTVIANAAVFVVFIVVISILCRTVFALKKSSVRSCSDKIANLESPKTYNQA